MGGAITRAQPRRARPYILGGIYGWVDLSIIGIDFAIRFTVTEAAAVAVVYALFVELVINRELEWKELPKEVEKYSNGNVLDKPMHTSAISSNSWLI